MFETPLAFWGGSPKLSQRSLEASEVYPTTHRSIKASGLKASLKVLMQGCSQITRKICSSQWKGSPPIRTPLDDCSLQ